MKTALVIVAGILTWALWPRENETIVLDYAGGHFIFEDGAWSEYQGGKKTFTFEEVSRAGGAGGREIVTLRDRSRGLYVRVPIDGGVMSWSRDAIHWNALYPVAPRITRGTT